MTLTFEVPDPHKTKFAVQVTVTAEGEFSCTLPELIATLMKDSGIELGRNRMHREGFFHSDTLAGLREQIGMKIKELCSEELESKEHVIRYFISTSCAYTIDPGTGNFMPNATNGQPWCDGTTEASSSCPADYGFQFYAHPFIKRTYRYTTCDRTRVTYTSMCEHNCDVDQLRTDPVQWLAHVVNQAGGGYNLFGCNDTRPEIPCTPENVAFFVNLYKSLFALNERNKPFLTPEGVQQLAAGNLKMLT